jgi:hypothetical protein
LGKGPLNKRIRYYRRKRESKKKTRESRTLSRIEVPKGMYTEKLLPRYEMSPGSLPSGMPVRPSSRSKPPPISSNNPKPTSSRPKSFMLSF